MFDLKITGGTIIDGTGAAGYPGAVGISGGRIAAIGDVDGDSRATIDATGRVVCPGFVDIHTHYDAQIVWDPTLAISPWHGITTVVMGNCGFSLAPTRQHQRDLILRTLERVEGMSIDALRAGVHDEWPLDAFPAYMDAVEKRGCTVNVACFIGHTAVRLFVMGEEAVKRQATEDEIEQMARVVREACEAGALGFTTSLAPSQHAYDGHPIPSRLATFEEIDRLFGAAREGGGVLTQGSIGRLEWLQPFAEIARRHRLPFSWSGVLSGMNGPGSHREILDRIRALVRDDCPVVPQVSPLPQEFEFTFDYPLPWERRDWMKPLLAAKPAQRLDLWRDSAFVASFKADRPTGFDSCLVGWAERTVICEHPGDATLAERPLAAVASERGIDPVDLAISLSTASGLRTRFRLAVLNYDEQEVGEILRDDAGVVGFSDAGAHVSQLCNAHFSTDLLERWVRQNHTLSVESAIHKLSARPAELLGLRDRGRLATGMAADILVFDPERIAATPLQRLRDLPAGADRIVCDAVGLDAVIVNGAVIRRQGHDVKAARYPGKLLRRP